MQQHNSSQPTRSERKQTNSSSCTGRPRSPMDGSGNPSVHHFCSKQLLQQLADPLTIETQAENAELDSWRFWYFLIGLSAPWVNPPTRIYKFHMGERRPSSDRFNCESVASFPNSCFLMKAVFSNNKRIKCLCISNYTMCTDPWDNHHNSILRRWMKFTTASIQCFHRQSLTVTTQTRRELLSRHDLCHAKCLEQLSNTSRWKTQKLKATFYQLTRHARQEPLAMWVLQVQLGLQLSAASVSWHPYPIPLDAVGLLHSFPMARVPSLEGKP